MKLHIQPGRAPGSLRPLLDNLAAEYPVVLTDAAPGAGDLAVRFETGAEAGVVEIASDGRAARIVCDSPARAARGVGALLAGLVKPGQAFREKTPFETVGMMLDCSRNAVMAPGHVQRWLRRLALMGYNMAMLYTENTYELPGEPYFGYRRGRYSLEELRAIDQCAAELGIEMIGCIQVLGHLEQLLRWPEYDAVKDTASVLMVDEEKTYALIDKMIDACASAFRSRRVHIGMDETFDLGRGRFMNVNGYVRGYDLFNRHLKRVSAICGDRGLKPMIWSDMYFRMGSPSHGYYDPECRIPDDVKKAIPREAQLVYWDYDHEDKAFYREWIRRHRELGSEPVMASAVGTIQRPWLQRSEKTVTPCVAACREEGLREIFFCLWGDDGAYCEFDSALAGLCHAAEAAYGGEAAVAERIAARFAAVCGADYGAVLTAAAMNDGIHPIVLLWDDPLLRVAWRNEKLKKATAWREADRHLAGLLRQLKAFTDVCEPVDLAHACRFMEFSRCKIRLNAMLDEAVPKADPAELARVQRQLRKTVRALDALMESFRRQWHRRNKPFGLETLQIRLGGQKERFAELSRRLDDLAQGRLAALPEFGEEPSTASAYTHVAWRLLAVSGLV